MGLDSINRDNLKGDCVIAGGEGVAGIIGWDIPILQQTVPPRRIKLALE